MTAATLVFAWGNPSRGDDALGPLFAETMASLALPDVECLTDFQLQVEHALDLVGRQRVLFVDASCAAPDGEPRPFSIAPLTAQRDASYTTHAMSPSALLQVFTDMEGHAPPPAWVLTIPGESWELGHAPTTVALERMGEAIAWAKHWLIAPSASLTIQSK
jgi:hydrogenase maturation protease